MAKTYKCFNAAMPTTAAMAAVTTSTAIKTMLQIATPSTEDLVVVAWGISFDGSAAGTPIKCELIDGDVAATGLTAHGASGIIKVNDPNAPASLMTLGTGATGFNTSGATEGTITASRVLDYQFVAPTNQYAVFLPLGREWRVGVSRFLRIRVTTGTAVNCICWIEWEE
jgi:hypothetical protein